MALAAAVSRCVLLAVHVEEAGALVDVFARLEVGLPRTGLVAGAAFGAVIEQPVIVFLIRFGLPVRNHADETPAGPELGDQVRRAAKGADPSDEADVAFREFRGYLQ